MSASGGAGGGGAYMLHNGPVFCSKGLCGVCRKPAARPVFPHSEPELYGDGPGRRGDPHHPDDQRCEPGAERREPDAAPAAAVPLRGVWRHGDGLYGGLESGAGVRRGDTAAGGGGVRYYAVDHAPV